MTELHRSIGEEQRNRFVHAVRQVMVDALSNVSGIFDGSTLLEQYRDYFHLTYGDDPSELNGDLQDIVLATQESLDEYEA